jgi:hypothetical protein
MYVDFLMPMKNGLLVHAFTDMNSSFIYIKKKRDSRSQSDITLTTETMNRNKHIFPSPSEATLEPLTHYREDSIYWKFSETQDRVSCEILHSDIEGETSSCSCII